MRRTSYVLLTNPQLGRKLAQSVSFETNPGEPPPSTCVGRTFDPRKRGCLSGYEYIFPVGGPSTERRTGSTNREAAGGRPSTIAPEPSPASQSIVKVSRNISFKLGPHMVTDCHRRLPQRAAFTAAISLRISS
jgi:hypothetical protein